MVMLSTGFKLSPHPVKGRPGAYSRFGGRPVQLTVGKNTDVAAMVGRIDRPACKYCLVKETPIIFELMGYLLAIHDAVFEPHSALNELAVVGSIHR